MSGKSVASKKSSLKTIIHELLDPYEDENRIVPQALSIQVDVFIMGCILCSCLLIPLEYYLPEYESVYWKCELAFTSLFALEYVTRWYCASDRSKYPFTRYAIIDLVAILPAVLMISSKFMVFRLARGIRFLRLLRLLKIFRYNVLIHQSINNLRIWFASFREQYRLHQLGNLFRLYFVAWIIGANLLYFTESHFASSLSPYAGYFKSYWNIIIVLISGIEDKEPLSVAGRVEVTVLLIAGICVVGMITGEIVSILVRKIERKGKVTIKPALTALSKHIVIFGNNTHLDYILHQIHAAFNGLYYILIVSPDAEQLKITDPEVYKKVMALQGDYRSPEVLKCACLDTAYRAIVLSEEMQGASTVRRDKHTLMHTLAVVSKNTSLPVTVQLNDKSTLKYTAPLASAEFIVSRNYLETLLSQAVLNPGITNIYRSLMTFSQDSNEFYKIPINGDADFKTFKDAQRYFLNSDIEIVPIGIYQSSVSSSKGLDHTCCLNPVSKKTRLARGDSLAVIAYQDPLLHFEKERGIIKNHLLKLSGHQGRGRSRGFGDVRATNHTHSFPRLQNRTVVICNFNPNVKQVVEELFAVEEYDPIHITLIAQNMALWESHPEWHPDDSAGDFRVIEGDPCSRDVLEKAGIRDCGAAIVLADPKHEDLADAPSALIAMSIEEINPEVHTIMELINSVNRQYIDNHIINEVVCRGDITENLIAQNCFLPGVKDIFHTLLTTRKGTPQIFLPFLPEKYAGKTYKEILLEIIETDVPCIVIGFIQCDEFVMNPKAHEHPGMESVLSEENQMIIISETPVVNL